MNGQQLRRWIVLGASVVGLTLLTMGSAPGASATNANRPDFHSKQDFKEQCEVHDGTFETDIFGDTHCLYKNGDRVQCNAQGKDCWYYPKPWTYEPVGPMDPDIVTGGVATDGGGTPTSTPVADRATKSVASQRLAARDDHQDQDTGKTKKAKKGKHGGKGRKK